MKNNYFLITFLLAIMLLKIIVTILKIIIVGNKKIYHHISNIKMESINESNEINIKNRAYYYFDNISI